jgi:hypothetical protein
MTEREETNFQLYERCRAISTGIVFGTVAATYQIVFLFFVGAFLAGGMAFIWTVYNLGPTEHATSYNDFIMAAAKIGGCIFLYGALRVLHTDEKKKAKRT